MSERQESNTTQESDYKDSLDYLRAKYLDKDKADYAGLKTTEANADAAESDTQDDLQLLQKKYSTKNKRDRLSLIRDISLLCVVIITALCSVIWFATPVTELGGEIYKDKTLNLFSFLFGSKDSMYSQISSGIENIGNIEADAENGIGSIMKLVRAVFLSYGGLYVLITIIVEVISALIYFFKLKPEKLVSVSVKSVINKLNAYIIFVFFGSVSGGVGINSYYVGYSIGTGMTVGILLSLSILIAASFTGYLSKRKAASTADIMELKRFFCSGIAYTAIAVVVTFMRIYSVFIYSITSTLTAIAGLATQSFKIKTLVFPALNILLLCACRLIVSKVSVGFKISYERLLNFGERESTEVKLKKSKQIKNTQLRYIIVILIVSAISCLAVFVLNIPSIGFAWSVNIYPHLIIIFAISSVATVFNSVIFKYQVGVKEGESKKAEAENHTLRA